MEKLEGPRTIFDDDWRPPIEYAEPTVNNVIRWWLTTVRQSTGSLPSYTDSSGQTKIYSPVSQRSQAELLVAKYGYVQVMRVLSFMASPLSGCYQWPYTLNAVDKAVIEFEETKSGRRKVIDHSGYIGPVGMRQLA